jgi:hypothetical protein
MFPVGLHTTKIYTDPKMALSPTDWTSLYIPNIVTGLHVSPAKQKWALANIFNMDLEKRKAFRSEDLQSYIENTLCLGKVRRIDFVEKASVTGIETSAFVHFEWWCYNTSALQLRRALDTRGNYRRHTYYVSTNGTNDHVQCFGFHTMNPPTPRFLAFMINLKPIPETDTMLNVHQLTAINASLETQVKDSEKRAQDAEKRAQKLEAQLHDIELRTKIVQFRESEVEKDKQKLEDEFDKKGDELYKQQKALYKKSDELYEQQKALYKKSDELYDREYAMYARDIALNRRGAELNRRGAELNRRDTELDRRDAALDRRGAELNRRDTELDRRDAALDRRDAALDFREDALDARNIEYSNVMSRFKGNAESGEFWTKMMSPDVERVGSIMTADELSVNI